MEQSLNENKLPIMNTESKETLQFPLTFDLKVVVDNTLTATETIQFLDKMMLRLSVANEYLGFKESSKGNFISHTFRVLLLDHPHLQELYAELKTLPGIKFAV
jgi:putative lipoic acid-binding regulatory protein